jgi:prepilin-type N-terminal cleavage/methylation domain-containing protein
MDMFKILKNERGFTIIELISVLAISTILILISAVGLNAFFVKNRELNTWVSIQKDAMNCLNTMKVGTPVGTQTETSFYGVINAEELELIGAASANDPAEGVICHQPQASLIQASDRSHFYFDGQAVRVNYVYKGYSPPTAAYLFPERGQLDEYEVLQFAIWQANPGEEVELIKVVLEARVKIREGYYKTLKYSTIMGKN